MSVALDAVFVLGLPQFCRILWRTTFPDSISKMLVRLREQPLSPAIWCVCIRISNEWIGGMGNIAYDRAFHGRAGTQLPQLRALFGSDHMILPPQYAWFEPVLIASVVVFVIDLIGSSLSFGNRFVASLMSAILFAIVFGALVYFGFGSVSMTVRTTPDLTAPGQVKTDTVK
jgi:hypothetical protein